MLDKLKPIEKAMEPLFKGLPQLQASAKKSVANVLEWCALVFGILQLLAALALWNAGQRVNDAVDFINSYTRAVGSSDAVDSLGFTFYLGLGLLILSAITLLIAYPKLKARKKEGWNWLFLGSLLNVVYGVVALLVGSRYGGGVSDFVMSLVGSAVSFWLLFQVKEFYEGKHKTEAEQK